MQFSLLSTETLIEISIQFTVKHPFFKTFTKIANTNHS